MPIHRPDWLSLSLIRFYLGLALTVPLIAYSVHLAYRWYTADSAPVVNLDAVLKSAFNLPADNTLRCMVSVEQDCAEAIYVEIAPEYWQPNNTQFNDRYLEIVESAEHILLCKHQEDQRLFCLRIEADQPPDDLKFIFSLVFYISLFVAFFAYIGTLFRDAAVLRASALNEIRFGKLPSFNLSPKSYLTPLATSLQSMTERINELSTFQTEIAETVCHDIKTPVARLRFLAHQLQKNGDELAAQQLNRNLSEIESNVNEYLLLAQNQYAPEDLSYDNIDLHEFLPALVDMFKLDNQLDITVTLPDNARLTANRRLLHRAIANILSNAMRFADKHIAVRVEFDAEYCHISVHDDGKAISSTTKAPTFTESVHHSMGLSIVRRVCKQHGGSFNLTSYAHNGHMATISLPAKGKDTVAKTHGFGC